jgi:Reverse transcriptase (RNA-dependent DNA polymerase)
MPKRSGLLRPYTILTVEDQLVYQGLVNVVAERFAPRVRSRYLVQTFGHLYAGSTSLWFYRRWRDGYRAFNKAARAGVKRGLVYTASFDLTACYDSLDHSVLCHFLGRLGCEAEFCSLLRQCLATWTATHERIYQNHGIPQGPLGSGLLSEVVLQHFDANTNVGPDRLYMRYVDDIRLFARREVDLRRLLVRLDKLSKDVGLFPQASKIDIHLVSDIDDELKTVSNPTEAVVKGKVVDQVKLTKRIVDLSPRLSPEVQIKNETRFKYLLAFANPSARLNARMLKITASRPDLVPSIARYFRRYKVLPESVSRELIRRVRTEQLYEYVSSDWVDVLDGRLRPDGSVALNRVLKRLWKPRSLAPDLNVAVGCRLIREGRLSYEQTAYAISRAREGWVRAQLVAALNRDHYGALQVERILNDALRDANPDVSLSAALQVANLSVDVRPPFRTIQHSGGKALRQFGILRRLPGRACGIEWSLARFTRRATGLGWRRIFGTDYPQAERMAVQMRALADTDATAFVNAADVFNDILLKRLYLHDGSLGAYTLGNIGSVLGSVRLGAAYPSVSALCTAIHNERLKSLLSHPVVKKTGKPTSRIPFKYLQVARRLYVRAIAEIAISW